MGGIGGPPPGIGGGFAGMTGGGPDTKPSDAKWVYAWVEFKTTKQLVRNPMMEAYLIDHKWGKNNWFINSPMFPLFGDPAVDKTTYIPAESFTKQFDIDFNKAKKAKQKDVKDFLVLAANALSRGQMKEFHEAMKEAEKQEAKHPLVKSYLIAKKKTANPLEHRGSRPDRIDQGTQGPHLQICGQ